MEFSLHDLFMSMHFLGECLSSRASFCSQNQKVKRLLFFFFAPFLSIEFSTSFPSTVGQRFPLCRRPPHGLQVEVPLWAWSGALSSERGPGEWSRMRTIFGRQGAESCIQTSPNTDPCAARRRFGGAKGCILKQAFNLSVT